MSQEHAAEADQTVLAVDLDGTLCRSDTLHEALLHTLTAKPAKVPGILSALTEGKVAFKRKVAEATTLSATALPINEEVLALVNLAREGGRRTVLVTASDAAQAHAVADELGLFDEVLATGSPEAGDVNLGGAAKAEFLTERYGERGFDYVGNAMVDVPVWKAARRAITVGAVPRLQGAAEAVNDEVVHLDPPGSTFERASTVLRAMRPHQWSKNLLVFLPMLAAHDLSVFPAALAAFVAFSMMASSVYLLNDLADLAADRVHPRKRFRPFAAGELPASFGLALAAGLIISSLLVAIIFTTPKFIIGLGIYYVTTFAYSFWLKRKLVMDVMVLAALYTSRLVGGGAATDVDISPWMLGFSMFLFLALAAVKRQAELTDVAAEGDGRAPGRAYMTEDLPIVRGIALASSHAAVLVLSIYITSDGTQVLYSRPGYLWFVCPILLYWLMHLVMATHRGQMTDDPIVFAAKDWESRFLIAAAGAAVIAASVL